MNKWLRAYRFYGLAWAVGLYLQMIWIYTSSTATGLQTGVYVVTLYTNTHAENYPEFIGMLSAVPALCLIVYDYLNLLKPKART